MKFIILLLVMISLSGCYILCDVPCMGTALGECKFPGCKGF